MILTSHILSGAALGANVSNPYAVAGLSFALHFVLDLFPHGDYLNKKSRLREFWKVAIDLTAGLGSIAAILFFQSGIPENNLLAKNIAIGVFFSILPDGTTFLCHWMKVKFFCPIYAFHQKLHLVHAPDFSPRRQFGLSNNLWDIFVSLTSLFLLFR